MNSTSTTSEAQSTTESPSPDPYKHWLVDYAETCTLDLFTGVEEDVDQQFIGALRGKAKANESKSEFLVLIRAHEDAREILSRRRSEQYAAVVNRVSAAA